MSDPLAISRSTGVRRIGSVSQRRLLTWGQQQLRRSGNGPHEARLLLEWALGVDSLLRAPEQVGLRAAERYRSAITQRRYHFPLQHITGTMHFRGLTLQAGPGVFIVRPETESLVEAALELIEGPSKVADLCAGSGAVGLSIAAEAPAVTVQSIELSPMAATYANRNIARCRSGWAPGSSATLMMGDAVQAFPGEEDTFDLVVSNPPYVPGQPPIQPEVLFDPEMALYGGGEDGLVLPRGIVVRAESLLRVGGWLLMEHAEEQAQPLRDFARQTGFRSAQTLNDLTGNPRFLKAQK